MSARACSARLKRRACAEAAVRGRGVAGSGERHAEAMPRRPPLTPPMLAGVEPPGDTRPAVGAAAVVETIETDGVPVALDHRRAAARAEGRLPRGIVHVANVAV